MHGDEHDGDADAEVDAQRVSEEHRGHEPGEDGGHRAAVLLQDGVRELEEKRRKNPLRCVVCRRTESRSVGRMSQGTGCRVQGAGCRVQDAAMQGCRDKGFRVRV